MFKSHKLTGLDGLDGPLDELLLLALLCGANKNLPSTQPCLNQEPSPKSQNPVRKNKFDLVIMAAF